MIVVAYNSEAHIEEMIRALDLMLSDIEAEVLIVDNASGDQTFDRAEAALSQGAVIRLNQNVGYGRGANAGLKAAGGRLSLILNDDVSVSPDSLRLLMEASRGVNVRLVAPLMMSPAGDTLPSARRYLPGLRDELARVTDFARGLRTRLVEPDGGSPIDVDFVLAACLLGETDYLRQIGGFSDAFFMYGEDIDLCRRVKSLGGRVLLVPEAIGRHDQAVAEGRRIRGHDFSERILDARDAYYRTWLSRGERVAINLFRSVGLSDQPYRFRYHFPKVFVDGPDLRRYRRPAPLEAIRFKPASEEE